MSRPPSPRPTDGELSILKVLWERGPSTVREVLQALPADTAYTTALKMLQIMTEKGLVERDESSRSHVYRPAESRERTQGELATDLADRAFGGSAAALVMRALAAKPASADELAEIRALLETLEDETDQGGR